MINYKNFTIVIYKNIAQKWRNYIKHTKTIKYKTYTKTKQTNIEKKPTHNWKHNHTTTHTQYTHTHNHTHTHMQTYIPKNTTPNWINFEEKNFKEVLAESWGKNYFKNWWAGSFTITITAQGKSSQSCIISVIWKILWLQKSPLL